MAISILRQDENLMTGAKLFAIRDFPIAVNATKEEVEKNNIKIEDFRMKCMILDMKGLRCR